MHRLLERTDTPHAPHATLLWGRRAVDESAPTYLGSYAGAISAPSVREPIENADVLILAGVQWTDLTSGFFTENLDPAKTIDVEAHSATVAGHTFAPISLRDALSALGEITHSASGGRAHEQVPHEARPSHDPGDALGQAALWDSVADALQPGDLVLADQGTSFYGMGTHRLPHDVVFIGQPLWAAIGCAWTFPRCCLPSRSRPAVPTRHRLLQHGRSACRTALGRLGATGAC